MGRAHPILLREVNPAEILYTIERYRATVVPSVPAVIQMVFVR